MTLIAVKILASRKCRAQFLRGSVRKNLIKQELLQFPVDLPQPPNIRMCCREKLIDDCA